MKHSVWYYIWWGMMPEFVHKLSLRHGMNQIKKNYLREKKKQIDGMINEHINNY